MRVYPVNLAAGTVHSGEIPYAAGQSIVGTVNISPDAITDASNSMRLAIEILRGDPNDEAQWVQAASLNWVGGPSAVMPSVSFSGGKHGGLARLAVALGKYQTIELDLS